MRFGSLMERLAAARQVHAVERPSLAFAKVQSVSPLRTLILASTLVLEPRVSTGDTAGLGRLTRTPARLWLGSTMLGLTATSSGQRLPRPRFCCASFQSESPRRTLTVCCVTTG